MLGSSTSVGNERSTLGEMTVVPFPAKAWKRCFHFRPWLASLFRKNKFPGKSSISSSKFVSGTEYEETQSNVTREVDVGSSLSAQEEFVILWYWCSILFSYNMWNKFTKVNSITDGDKFMLREVLQESIYSDDSEQYNQLFSNIGQVNWSDASARPLTTRAERKFERYGEKQNYKKDCKMVWKEQVGVYLFVFPLFYFSAARYHYSIVNVCNQSDEFKWSFLEIRRWSDWSQFLRRDWVICGYVKRIFATWLWLLWHLQCHSALLKVGAGILAVAVTALHCCAGR